MLLLVTIGLVLIGAVSLVIGFISNELGWIYLSIVCSIVAAAVLVAFSRMSRTAPAPSSASGPAPLADSGEPTAPVPTAPVAVPEAAAAPVATTAAAPAAVEFPIPNYDSLKVNEILPQLANLDLDQLDAVRAREESGKNRATVIARIDDRMDVLEAEEDAATAAPAPVDEPAPADATAAVAAAGVAGGGAELAGAAVAEDSIDDLIEDYDKLTPNQILPLLSELDEDELEDVAVYEEDHKNRDAILDRIDELLEGGGEAAAAPAAKKAPAKKAPAKRPAPAKSAGTSKKAVATKTAGLTKKTAAVSKTQSAHKAASPSKSAAKSAPAKRAPTKSVAAPSKTAAKKAAAPAKKAATASKATAKKAPAKKAAKATKK